jgi:hypothetical protein
MTQPSTCPGSLVVNVSMPVHALVRILFAQPQNLPIPPRIFDFYGCRNSPETRNETADAQAFLHERIEFFQHRVMGGCFRESR